MTKEVGTLLCPDSGEACWRATCYAVNACIIRDGSLVSADPEDADDAARTYGDPCPHAPDYRCWVASCVPNCDEGADADAPQPQALQPLKWQKPKSTAVARHAPPCHTGPTHVLTLPNDLRIWAARQSDVGRCPPGSSVPWTLCVSLIDGQGLPPVNEPKRLEQTSGCPGARFLLPAQLFDAPPPIPYLHIDWPDYGAPDMDRLWWSLLVEALDKLSGDVVIYCMGGHGRTGTAIAILLAMADALHPGEDPVAVVRSLHCSHAVESQTQLDYIEQITGLKSAASVVWSAQTKWLDDWDADLRKHAAKPASKKPGPPKQEPDFQRLSLNRYKRIAKAHAIARDLPPIKKLDDKQLITLPAWCRKVGAPYLFQWDKASRTFSAVGGNWGTTAKEAQSFLVDPPPTLTEADYNGICCVRSGLPPFDSLPEGFETWTYRRHDAGWARHFFQFKHNPTRGFVYLYSVPE